MLSIQLSFSFALFLFATGCWAVCCSNHNKLCIFNAQECTPNCSDGISMCDLSSQTCKNDNLGGCLDNVVVVSTRTIFPPSTTVTVFTDTTTIYESTSTETLLVTSTDVVSAVQVATVTNVSTPPSALLRHSLLPCLV